MSVFDNINTKFYRNATIWLSSILLTESFCLFPVPFVIHSSKFFFIFNIFFSYIFSLPCLLFSLISSLFHCTSPYILSCLCSGPPLIHSLHFGRIVFVGQICLYQSPTWNTSKGSRHAQHVKQNALYGLYIPTRSGFCLSSSHPQRHTPASSYMSPCSLSHNCMADLLIYGYTMLLTILGSLHLLFHVSKVLLSFSAYQVHAYTSFRPHLRYQFHRETFS